MASRSVLCSERGQSSLVLERAAEERGGVSLGRCACESHVGLSCGSALDTHDIGDGRASGVTQPLAGGKEGERGARKKREEQVQPRYNDLLLAALFVLGAKATVSGTRSETRLSAAIVQDAAAGVREVVGRCDSASGSPPPRVMARAGCAAVIMQQPALH